MLILDTFFMKYEGWGVKLTPQKRLLSKSQTLLGLNLDFS